MNAKKTIILVVLALAVLGGVRWYKSMASFDPKKQAEEKLSKISPGMSLAEVVKQMGPPQAAFRYTTGEGTDKGLPIGETVKLTVLHDDFPAGSTMRSMVSTGWPHLLSDLKTLLETGDTLPQVPAEAWRS